MKKGFVLLFMFCFSVSAFTQQPTAPILLNWETYFKGSPQPGSPFLALTALSWTYNYRAVIKQNKVNITFTNEVSIDKSKSWVKWDEIKDETMNKNLLHHEQGHANILFLLFKEADSTFKSRNYSVKNYKAEIARLAEGISNYYDDLQKKYDEETEHGSNHRMQAYWDKIIADKLASVNP